MFELEAASYIEGAPYEWRHWLTPGTPAVVRFSDQGIEVLADAGSAALRWSDIAFLAARGPDAPERRRGGYGIFGLLDGLWRFARRDMTVSYSYLVIGLGDGVEMIFLVDGSLWPELDAVLAAHAGPADGSSAKPSV
jgi:hypothetical protein